MKKIKTYIKTVLKKLYRTLYKISPKPCKKALLKCKALVRSRKSSKFMPIVSISSENYAENLSFALNSVPLAKTSKGRIAVQVHIDDFSSIPEFFKYINNIPYPFDLYIS